MSDILPRIEHPHDLKKLSLDELQILAGEIRERIMDTVDQNGGHLASNLGSVELTLALHRVFDLPQDRLVWDTSHQTYPHKIPPKPIRKKTAGNAPGRFLCLLLTG